MLKKAKSEKRNVLERLEATEGLSQSHPYQNIDEITQ